MNNKFIELLYNARKDSALKTVPEKYSDEEVYDILLNKFKNYSHVNEFLENIVNENDLETLDLFIYAKEKGLLEDIFEKEKEIFICEAGGKEFYLVRKNNIYFLKSIYQNKKGDLNISEKFLFNVVEAVEYNDILDGGSLKILKALNHKDDDVVEIEYDNTYKIYNICSAKDFKNSLALYETAHKVISQQLVFEKKLATRGLAFVKYGNELIIPELIKRKDLYYSDEFRVFYRNFMNTKLSEIIAENIIYHIAQMRKPHNLLFVLSLISSLLIHVIKPSILPPVVLWGESATGKTEQAYLYSVVKIPNSTTTTHQFLKKTSGFRVGLAVFDEKKVWDKLLIDQIYKEGATNLGRVERTSKDVYYITNVQIMNISNKKVKFLVDNETEFKAILRRGWFLKIDKDDIASEYSAHLDYLEPHKYSIFRLFYESFKKVDIPPFCIDKWMLLEQCYEIFLDILKLYGEDYDDNVYKELVKRMKKSEKEVFVSYDLLDIIVGEIIKLQINMMSKLRKEDYLDEFVVDSTFMGYGVCITEDKIIMNKRGWDTIAKSSGLPDFETYEEIENYLQSHSINAEYTRAYLCNKRIRGIVIHHNLQLSEYSELEEKIISFIEAAGRPVMEYELYSIDENEELIEKILEKLKKEGRISEIRPGEYII